MKLRQYYVYIMMNATNSTSYIGVTGNLLQRAYQHRECLVDGFTKKYKLNKLVYYDICDSAEQAIAREKQLKNWHRDWKYNLIRSMNPTMSDLYDDLIGMPKQVRHDAALRHDDTSVRYDGDV